jgi:hypothetical protein
METKFKAPPGRGLLPFLIVFLALLLILAGAPAAAAATATVTVSGEGVVRSRTFTVDDLRKMLNGRVDAVYTMQTLVEPHHGRYTGVSLYILLRDAVGLCENAAAVKIVSTDGVSVVLALGEVKKSDYINGVDKTLLPVILAYAREGHNLVAVRGDPGFRQDAGNDGGPVRLMVGQTVPGERNSPKCLKHVARIEVSTRAPTVTFNDIGQFFSWAREAIEHLAERGIVGGIGDGRYAPEKELTRAEFTSLITRALSIGQARPFRGTFRDVPAGAWYAYTVEAAAGEGIIGGYPDGTFRPGQSVNRREMVSMIIRAMGLQDEAARRTGNKITYRDRDSIPSWVAGSVELAEELGLLDNIAVGFFNGTKEINRAEAAVIVYRMLRQMQKL